MSSTNISFHRVVTANVRNLHSNRVNWVEITFTDEDGNALEVTVFSDDTQAILSALAKGDDKALTAAYAEGRKDEREAINAEQVPA